MTVNSGLEILELKNPLGDTPNGIQYRCDFHGMFTEPAAKNNYTYQFEIDSNQYDGAGAALGTYGLHNVAVQEGFFSYAGRKIKE